MQAATIEFLTALNRLRNSDQLPASADRQARVQALVDRLPWSDFDTEERELLADVLAPAIESLGVDPWALF